MVSGSSHLLAKIRISPCNHAFPPICESVMEKSQAFLHKRALRKRRALGIPRLRLWIRLFLFHTSRINVFSTCTLLRLISNTLLLKKKLSSGAVRCFLRGFFRPSLGAVRMRRPFSGEGVFALLGMHALLMISRLYASITHCLHNRCSRPSSLRLRPIGGDS